MKKYWNFIALLLQGNIIPESIANYFSRWIARQDQAAAFAATTMQNWFFVEFIFLGIFGFITYFPITKEFFGLDFLPTIISTLPMFALAIWVAWLIHQRKKITMVHWFMIVLANFFFYCFLTFIIAKATDHGASTFGIWFAFVSGIHGYFHREKLQEPLLTFGMMIALLFGIWLSWGSLAHLVIFVFLGITALCSSLILGSIAIRFDSIKNLEVNLRVQEEHFQEKKRIMRDLHDAVGSGLTQILYLIREKDSRKRIGLEETAQETLLKLRDLVFLLNREKDFSVYLIQEMKTFLARIKTIGKYEMNIDFRYANQLNSRDSLHLYYIFCECLTNIVKHAKADLIQIKLVSYGKWVFLVISDNGIGMQMTKNNLQEGTGLSNIRFRINELQGKMRIAKKNGTAIFFMIPKKILK